MIFKKLKCLNEKGQTMVEYVLLIAVVIVIMNSVFTQLSDFLINNPNSLQGRYLRSFENVFSNGDAGVNARYKRFSIIK